MSFYAQYGREDISKATSDNDKMTGDSLIQNKMPTQGVTVRSSNIELYRILLMLLIVAHHYVVNSGLEEVLLSEPVSIKSLSFLWFGMWGKTGINCFVLITGYYMCASKITLKKYMKMLFEVEFYKVLLFAVFVLSGYEHFSVMACLKALLPVYMINTNFVGCFLIFYLFIPFLNILVRNMSKNEHKWLVIFSLSVFSLFGTIPKINVTMNYVEWFCVLYFISSYIRLYGLPVKLTSAQWGGYMVVTILISMLSVWGILHYTHLSPYYFVSDSNHVMAVLISFLVFMTFKTMKMPYCKFINVIAQSIFGVLLIHANSDTMRQWLWRDTVNVLNQYQSPNALLLAIGTVIIIFAACIVIDQLRIKFIEQPLFNYMNKRGWM